MILFFMTVAELSQVAVHSPVLGIYDVHRSKYLSENESMVFNIYDHSTHNVYVDIGCFNGETIEHFIHFNPQSILYDIITFEPDPVNYRLCKQKLSQAKFKNYNIYIIPKVAWTHNGKVTYRIGRGEQSGIYHKRYAAGTTDLVQLDAIDFSSWLPNFMPSNRTKVHIKLSMPGFETRLLRKMTADNTMSLAERWDVEWTDRSNPRTFPERIYLQLMFDTFGFTCTSHTLLQDTRRIYQHNLPFENVTKYYDLKELPHTGTFSHYVQRPSAVDVLFARKTRVRLVKA